MRFSDESYNLRIGLDTKHCDLSPEEIHKMERGLAPLREPVADFPVSDLYITLLFNSRSKDYHLKTSLVLPGRTLFTGDRDAHAYTAFERCVRKLVKKVEQYKAELQAAPELAKHEKGTRHEVAAEGEPDAGLLEEAVSSGDYVAFRRALYAYEESLRKRIGRWVQRYDEVDQRIGNKLSIADIEEEVFLNAFEGYSHRPAALRLGQWLENLIDPSIKLLERHSGEEIENIRFAHTLREAPPGGD